MSETTVYVRMPRSRVLDTIRGIPATARQGGSADAILEKAGRAFLRRAHRAFKIKSRGGTDECGERWASLALSTIMKKRRKKAPTGSDKRPSSLLTDLQRDRWWSYYRRAMYKFKDKATAARVAWAQLKRTDRTVTFERSAVEVPILIETGDLMRSLLSGSPSEFQVFRVEPGVATIGTRRRGAAAHHSGAPHLPQRRLWPPPERWTLAWWEEVLVGARDGVVQLIVEKLR